MTTSISPAVVAADALIRGFNGYYEGLVLLDRPLSDDEVRSIPALYEGDRSLESKYGLEGIRVSGHGLVTFEVQANGSDEPWNDLSMFMEKVLEMTGAGITACQIQGHLIKKAV